jgi:hypothetical protein
LGSFQQKAIHPCDHDIRIARSGGGAGFQLGPGQCVHKPRAGGIVFQTLIMEGHQHTVRRKLYVQFHTVQTQGQRSKDRLPAVRHQFMIAAHSSMTDHAGIDFMR